MTTAYWLLVFSRQDTRRASCRCSWPPSCWTSRAASSSRALQNKIEVTQTEAELATRREGCSPPRTPRKGAEDNLRGLVLGAVGQVGLGAPLVASSRTATSAAAGALDVNRAIESALSWRADVAARRERRQRAEVDVASAPPNWPTCSST